MRAASKILTSLGSLAILGIGWQAGAGTASTTTATSASSAGSSSRTSSSGTTSSGTTGSGASGSGASGTGTTASGAGSGGRSSSAATNAPSKNGTYTGSDISTEFGNVQVKVVVSAGHITDVVALHLTDSERRSVQISARAEPILKSEVLASQNARISNVSGATYTSDAYIQSLQSALDQAGL